MSEELKEEVKTDNSEVKKENTFTQDDVSNVVAKNVKEERAKILKELGIEDVSDAKKALKELKTLQDSQKSEFDKLAEASKEKDTKIIELSQKVKDRDDKDKIGKVLKELEIDSQYSNAIFKLVDRSQLTDELSDKDLTALINKTVDDYLPNLKGDKSKVGVGKREKDPTPSTNDYLKNKYKNNPFYNGK